MSGIVNRKENAVPVGRVNGAPVAPTGTGTGTPTPISPLPPLLTITVTAGQFGPFGVGVHEVKPVNYNGDFGANRSPNRREDWQWSSSYGGYLHLITFAANEAGASQASISWSNSLTLYTYPVNYTGATYLIKDRLFQQNIVTGQASFSLSRGNNWGSNP